MSDAVDVLRDQYNAVISQETDWGFFVSLAGFVDYILEMPALKKTADEVMSVKRKEYEKLAELEEKAIKELERAKIKLLKIIKTNSISQDSLISVWSSIPQGSNNILDRLEAFEKGEISISGFKSDNLEHFLFDIASSLLKLRHQSLVKGFLVSDEEYGRYHYNPDSGLIIARNENGNFIFSQTLKLRREQSRLIENAERYELWGAFDALLKLQIAYSEKSKNVSFGELLQKYGSEANNYQEAQDAVDVVFYAEDLSAISGINNNSVIANHDIRYHLKKEDFKNHLSRVNTYLLKELVKPESKEEIGKEDYGLSFDEGKSVLTIKSIPIDIQKFKDQYHTLKIIFDYNLDILNECFFSEIAEHYIQEDRGKRLPDKKFYNAIYQINQKIVKEAGIKDYFLTTAQSFRINPEYVRKT